MSALADGDRGRNAPVVPVVDVEPGSNGYESATTAHKTTLRSGPKARVDIGGDGSAATTNGTQTSGVSVEALRRREPDLDRFVAALLALAVTELDSEHAKAAE